MARSTTKRSKSTSKRKVTNIKSNGVISLSGKGAFVKSTMTPSAVDHPLHYGGAASQYETIKVIEAWELDFHLGSTVKYISRAGKKDVSTEIQDLEKAEWYLRRKINNLKLAQKAMEVKHKK